MNLNLNLPRITLPVVALAMAIAGLAAPITAEAAFVQVSLNGTVTSVASSNGLLPAALSGAAAGQSMSIVYTIDTLTPNTGNSVNGFYDGALTAMTVIVNGSSFSIPVAFNSASSHAVTNSAIVDSVNYSMEGCTAVASGCYQGAASFTLLGANPTALSSTALVAIPTLASFPVTVMQFFADTGDFNLPTDIITGTITSVTAVPLPASAWLLLSGLVGLAVFSRRRQLAGFN